MDSLELINAGDLAAALRAKKASAVEATAAALARIRALNPKLNAFITVDEEGAMKQAAAADQALAQGAPLGPLHGVPICLKDNISTRGLRTTAGSRLLENHVPDHDATVTARLRAAGAIIVGKTQMNEFARAPWVFGDVHNPWDLRRSPSGSSSGTGAAVGASLTPAGLGHDTGGSGRNPAAHCGVVGLMPTYGRVSRHGVIPSAWSFDHVTPCARTVEDAALVLGAIGGYDPQDPTSSSREVPPFPSRLEGGVKGLRIGLSKRWFFEDLNPEVERGVRAAIETLEGLGARSQEVSFPSIETCIELGDAIVSAETATYHEKWMDEQPEKYGAGYLELLRVGRMLPATAYLKAQQLRRVLRAEFARVMEEVDVLVSPTTRDVAALLRPAAAPEPNVDKFRRLYMGAGLTYPFNQVRMPAISVPCGFSSEGLPIGMQIAARPFEEVTLLRTAYAYEQHTDWHQRRPTL